MSAIKTIYLNEDTLMLIDKKRKEDENFNLSAFVSCCLVKDFGKESQSIDQMNQEIEQKKAQIKFIEAEINSIVLKIKEIVENNFQLKKEQDEEEKIRLFNLDMRNFWENISDETMAKFKEGIKSGKWRSSIEFYKAETGYKEDQE